jgi:mannose-6-phosphate isomerase-like protein (cupin superfamily)
VEAGEPKLTAPAEPPSDQVGTRLLFENERVRVWDFALAPGESLERHVHRTDYVYIVVSGGLLRVSDPGDTSRYRDVQFEDDQVTFVPVQGEKVDNRHTNVGGKPHRNFVIELKK